MNSKKALMAELEAEKRSSVQHCYNEIASNNGMVNSNNNHKNNNNNTGAVS